MSSIARPTKLFHRRSTEGASAQPLRIILTFTPAGIEKFFEETLERAYDLSRACPDNLAEVGARYAAAAPRFGLQFFLEPAVR